MEDSNNPLKRADDWYRDVLDQAIDDDGVRQQCHFEKLLEKVKADPGSAQIMIQLKEKELKDKGADDGRTLRGVWIAAAFLLSTDVNDEAVRFLRRFAPSMCQKAMDLLKENGLI